MDEFQPPRQPGSAILASLIALCLGLILLAGWQMAQGGSGERFVLALMLALAGFLPLPWLGYHLYALQRAAYLLDRDRLILRWGLRLEQIPIADLEWVRAAAAQENVPSPPLHLAGLLIGRRRTAEWGEVEFLASDSRSLLFVGTVRGVYAISPSDSQAFLATLQRVLESGSLTTTPAQSLYPSFVVVQAWSSPWARFFWIGAFLINVGLLAWTGWLIPALPGVSLGFLANRQPAEAVPGTYLLLLPIISLFFFFVAWVAGLFLYRRAEQRPLAHVLWFGSLLSSIAYLLALRFVLLASL